MTKTWFKEYEKIKDKAVVVYPYEWDCMSEKQRNKILSKKTVIMSGESGYACKYYEIIGNVNNLSDHDCAIIADGGNLCFGYRMEGQRIVVYPRLGWCVYWRLLRQESQETGFIR